MGIPSTLIKTLTQQVGQKHLATLFLGGLLSLILWGCTNPAQNIRLVELPDLPTPTEVRRLSGSISEVAPPAVLLDLATLSAQYQPQVAITSPKANQVIATDKIEVKLKLKGLSLYKDESLALGPHLQIMLDHQPARSIYNLEDSITFEALAPGSHTLQVVAVNPWGESFKNETAYAQTTFHVFANTGENTPNPEQPLLTYLEPQGTYGAEPILLDFYLNNAPLHQIAQARTDDDIVDWQIRCTVNGQSFVLDQWQPIYLKGLTPGENWVQLSLIDRQGNPIENSFNSTVRTLTYNPKQRDSLSKIVRGELPLEKIGQIVDAGYEPPVIVEPPVSLIERSEQDEQSADKAKEEAENGAKPDDSQIDDSQIDEPQIVEPVTAEPEIIKTPAAKTIESESSLFSAKAATKSKSTADDVVSDDILIDSDRTNDLIKQSLEDSSVGASSSPTEKDESDDTTKTTISEENQAEAEETDAIEETDKALSTSEDEASDVESLFQKFGRFFKSTEKSNAIKNPPATQANPLEEELTAETNKAEPATAELTKTSVEPSERQTEVETQESDEKASDFSEQLPSDDEVEFNASEAIEPLTVEAIDSSTIDEATDSAPDTVEPSMGDTAPLVGKENRDRFSQWSSKVKTFFQRFDSSGPAAESSNRLLIEELPVIIDEQATNELTDSANDDLFTTEPEAAQPEAAQLLTDLDIKSASKAAKSKNGLDAIADDRIPLEREIEAKELIDKDTEVEGSLEDIIVPGTLSAPSQPSENVIAPVKP